MSAEQIAQSLHVQCGVEYIMVTGSGFFQENAGIKSVNDIFINEVKKNKKNGMIIIIDEADALLNNRDQLNPDSEAYRIMNQILSLIGTKSNDRLIIMTSNYLKNLDDAMERRIDYFIKISLPGHKKRVEILNLYKKNLGLKSLTDQKIEDIAIKTEDFSPSDLSGVLEKLKMKSNRNVNKDIEEDIDEIVQEYLNKKELFKQQRMHNQIFDKTRKV